MGTGIKRINDSMRLNNLNEAKFKYYDHSFYVELNDSIVKKSDQVSDYVSDQVSDQVKILTFCKTERSIMDLMELLNLKHRTYFRNKLLNPLIEKGLIELTLPDKPKSSKQKYIITSKGLGVLRYNNLYGVK